MKPDIHKKVMTELKDKIFKGHMDSPNHLDILDSIDYEKI